MFLPSLVRTYGRSSAGKIGAPHFKVTQGHRKRHGYMLPFEFYNGVWVRNQGEGPNAGEKAWLYVQPLRHSTNLDGQTRQTYRYKCHRAVSRPKTDASYNQIKSTQTNQRLTQDLTTLSRAWFGFVRFYTDFRPSIAVANSAQTFGYLKNRVPDADGYWNGYRVPVWKLLRGCYLQILLHSTMLHLCLYYNAKWLFITKGHVMVVTSPPVIGGDLSDAFVWRLSVAYIGPNSRTEAQEDQNWRRGSPRHTSRGHHFQSQKVKVTRPLYSARP